MATDLKDNYQTYRNKVANLNIDVASLKKGHYFDTDLMVVAFEDSDKNARLAQIAKKQGVTGSLPLKGTPTKGTDSSINCGPRELKFTTHLTLISVLRIMIETPVVLNMLRNTEDEFFTATLRLLSALVSPWPPCLRLTRLRSARSSGTGRQSHQMKGPSLKKGANSSSLARGISPKNCGPPLGRTDFLNIVGF